MLPSNGKRFIFCQISFWFFCNIGWYCTGENATWDHDKPKLWESWFCNSSRASSCTSNARYRRHFSSFWRLFPVFYASKVTRKTGNGFIPSRSRCRDCWCTLCPGYRTRRKSTRKRVKSSGIPARRIEFCVIWFTRRPSILKPQKWAATRRKIHPWANPQIKRRK